MFRLLITMFAVLSLFLLSLSSVHSSAVPRCIEGSGWVAHVLPPFYSIEKGQYIESISGRYQFRLTCDGDIGVFDTKHEVFDWRAGVRGGHRVILDDEGNLILLDSEQQIVWQTGINRKINCHSRPHKPAVVLAVDDTGFAAVVACGHDVLWQSHNLHVDRPPSLPQ